jgi:hypothetical protein
MDFPVKGSGRVRILGEFVRMPTEGMGWIKYGGGDVANKL